MPSKGRVALVLGAGGARGYAHIGAIEVLAERSYEVVAVAGCSMGALVGGIFSAGKLDELSDWALGLSQREVLRLVDVSVSGPGVMRAERVLAKIRELVGQERIENLAVPFTAVATDLLGRRQVWFQRGPLDVAIRASISLPGILTPVMLNGRLLADGGLLEPLPVAPTVAVPADLTVAIALSGQRETFGRAVVAESAEPGPLDQWVERFRRGAPQAFHASDDAEDGEAQQEQPELLPARLRGPEVMSYALEAMQDVVYRYRLASFPPDVLITVPRDAAGTLDFHLAAPMIELGRALAAQALDEYETRRTSGR